MKFSYWFTVPFIFDRDWELYRKVLNISLFNEIYHCYIIFTLSTNTSNCSWWSLLKAWYKNCPALSLPHRPIYWLDDLISEVKSLIDASYKWFYFLLRRIAIKYFIYLFKFFIFYFFFQILMPFLFRGKMTALLCDSIYLIEGCGNLV